MFKKILLPFLLLILLNLPGFSQVSIKDSAIFTPAIFGSYSYQFIGGDLSKIFGGNSSIGGGLIFKTKSNWLIGAEGNYLFGGDVKISRTLLSGIVTHEGYVLDPNGLYADVFYYERGFNVFAKFGKVIPVLTPNPNSGITIMAGAGYMQDKIRIHTASNDVPELDGDYAKGYDRLNNGPVLTGSLGYLYLGSTRLLNFYLGFEFIQAWTKYRRDRDFDTYLHPDTKTLSSQFYGIKVSWFIPLYKRTPQAYYLY
jgi:hypothetical protein